MERYPRLFVQASLVYLAIGTAMGAFMGAGVLNRYSWSFIHLHVNLLGFMTLIVSGVAYHVIPRFTGQPVKHPRLIGIHFWLANIGLVGMIATRGVAAAGITQIGLPAFPLFAFIAAAGAFLFVWNLFPLLRRPAAREIPRQVDPRMKVSEVLARWPASLSVFRAHGFAALGNPAARATFAKLVSLEKACRIHKVDVEAFVAALNEVAAGGGIPLTVVEGDARRDPPSRSNRHSTGLDKNPVGRNVQVGHLIRNYPATRAVMERYFGPDCFSCPGQFQETLEQAASMHGVDSEDLLRELNSVIQSADEPRSKG